MTDPKKWERRRFVRQNGCTDCRYHIRSLKACSRGEENCILLSEDLSDGKPPCEYCYWWSRRRNTCVLGPDACAYQTGRKDEEEALCNECPYGNSRPCVGVCLKNVRAEWRKIRKAVRKAGEAMA